MSTTQLSPHSTLSLPGLPTKQEFQSLADRGLRIELAFFNRSAQWIYKLQQGMKRGFDVVAASLGLLLISPLLRVIALLIKLTSNGPVLYKSERIGKNYQPVHMYKFRTMSVDADAKREERRKQANLEGGLVKLANDP